MASSVLEIATSVASPGSTAVAGTSDISMTGDVSVRDQVEPLVEAWERFSAPLRMRDGFDDRAFEALISTLNACAHDWQGSDSIPRVAANVLVDVVPTMETFASSYPEPTASKIREATWTLQELVWKCVSVEGA